MEQTLSGLEKQRNNLYDLLEKGVYSTELFTERSKILSDKIMEAQTTLEAARRRAASGQALEKNRFEIIPRVEYVLDTYPELTDVSAKNALLKEVLDKVIYSKTKGGRWSEDDMQVYIFPKIEEVPPLLRLLP